MVSRLVVLLCCVLLAGAVATAQPSDSESKGAAHENPIAPTARSIESGKATYQKYCRFCHGPDAKGDGPQAPKGSHPPDLTDSTWLHGDTDMAIFTVIQDGAGPDSVMKGYKPRLSAEETWNIVNYLRSLGANR